MIHNRNIAAVFLILCTYASAQIDNTEQIIKAGTTAAQFLKIGVDARASAMGNAFTAISGDLSSMYWNPGGLADVQGIQFLFVNNNWLYDISVNYLAFAVNLRNWGVFGGSIVNLGAPEQLVRIVEEPDGYGEYFSVNNLAVTFSYARRLTDKFSIGGNVKYIQETIWHSSARAIAIDFGSLFITPFNDIRIGASLSNWGNTMQMTGRDLRFSTDPDPLNEGNVEFINALYETDKYPLPLLFRVGLAGELVKTQLMRVSFAIDAMHPNDNLEAVNVGAEYAFAETFFLRGGYSNLYREDSEEGLSFGGGLKYRIWRTSNILTVNYSFTDFNRLVGVSRISIGMQF